VNDLERRASTAELAEAAQAYWFAVPQVCFLYLNFDCKIFDFSDVQPALLVAFDVAASEQI
jgi:hypothetical protein